MKKMLTWSLLIIAALVAYKYLQTPLTPEMESVKELSDGFRQAVREYNQAGKSAAVGGIDTSAGAEAAVDRVSEIRSRLESLQLELEEEKAIEKAKDLMERVRRFLNQID